MSCVVADAVDYRGLPADKSKTGGWVPAALALGLLFLLQIKLSHEPKLIIVTVQFLFSLY